MPIYEYQCISCGERCEILQKVNDPPTIQCPHCNAHQLERVVSTVGFQLKGSGWYVTDFRQPPEKDKNKETHATDTTKSDEKKAEPQKPKTPETKTEN